MDASASASTLSSQATASERTALARLPARERHESLCAFMTRIFADQRLMSQCRSEAGASKLDQYRFARLCRALTACAERSDLKAHQRFDILVPARVAFLWFTGQSLFPLMRLILPMQDMSRRTYNMKETRIAKVYASVLNVPSSSFGMTQFKAKARVGKAAGDFGAAAEVSLVGRTTVSDPRPASSRGPTLADVNKTLDRLSMADTDAAQRAVILHMIQTYTPSEHKWLLRIVLKDLKARVRHEAMLAHFHEAAREIYNSRNDLETICSSDEFRRPPTDLMSRGILLGKAFHPMLCGRLTCSGSVGGKVSDSMRDARGGAATFVIEEKLDGERLLIHKDGATIRCFTRRTNDYTAHYEPVLRDVIMAGVKAERAILDGEVLAVDTATGKTLSFGQNRTVADEEARGVSGTRTICFVAFDILWVERPAVAVTREGDITRLPLLERRKLLEAVVPPASRVPNKLHVLPSHVVPSTMRPAERAATVERSLDEAIAAGSEGLVIKNVTAPYVCGGKRERLWLKIKPEYMDGSYDTMDLVVVGAFLGEGRKDRVRSGGLSSFTLAVADRQPSEGPAGPHAPVAARWKTIGKVGTGYSFEQLERLRERLTPHMRAIASADEIPGKAPYMADWRPPRKDMPDFVIDHPRNSVVMEVCAAELQRAQAGARLSFSAGVALRFPRVEKLRPDKGPQDAATMADVRQVMTATGGKLTRSGGESQMLSRVAARARKRAASSQDAAQSAKRLAASRAPRLDDRFVESDAVRRQAAESDALASLEVVVYPTSFGADDLSRAGDDADLPRGHDPAEWVRILLRRLGASVTQNCLETTQLAVGARGHRIATHKRWCERTGADIDVVTPGFIQACVRARARLDPLPHEHLVHAGAATRAKLPSYADALGDHFTQPLTTERFDRMARSFFPDGVPHASPTAAGVHGPAFAPGTGSIDAAGSDAAAALVSAAAKAACAPAGLPLLDESTPGAGHAVPADGPVAGGDGAGVLDELMRAATAMMPLAGQRVAVLGCKADIGTVARAKAEAAMAGAEIVAGRDEEARATVVVRAGASSSSSSSGTDPGGAGAAGGKPLFLSVDELSRLCAVSAGPAVEASDP